MLGENNIFTWKNKKVRKREEEEYAKWAFPYGQPQRERLTALLRSIFPHEAEPAALVSFLTCRELYEEALRSTGERDAAIESAIKLLPKYKGVVRKKDILAYLTLVLVHEETGGQADEYPPTAEIVYRIDEMKRLYDGK